MEVNRKGLKAEIKKPDYNFIKEWSKDFYKDEANRIKDIVLKEYIENHMGNTDIDNVLMKVTLINSFYNTFIQNDELVSVAQHIVRLNELLENAGKSLDEKIKDGDSDTVNFIAYYSKTKKLPHNIYSFASKYCSFHNQKKFPIVDSYSKGMIYFINKSDTYCSEYKNTSMNSLNDYEVFCKLYKAFQETYARDNDNNTLSFKEIDQYLWLYATKKANEDAEFKKLIRIDDSDKPKSLEIKI